MCRLLKTRSPLTTCHHLASLCLIALVAACSSRSSNTAINLTVNSDAALSLDKVSVTVRAPGKSDLHLDRVAANSVMIDLFVSGLSTGTFVNLEVGGVRGGSTVIIARARVAVVQDQHVPVVVHLAASCLDVLSCDADQTCDQGACVPIPTTTPDGGVATGGAPGGSGGASSGTGGQSGGSGGGTAGAGTTGSGGVTGSGGAAGAGGVPGSGGVMSSGGITGSGGAGGKGPGGMTGSGGAGGKGSGGITGSGGVMSSGGTMGSGGMCAAPQHLCGTACVANDAAHCGSSCQACTAPTNGTPTCNGTSCDFTCANGTKRCPGGATCVPNSACCTAADCPTMAGGQTGTCDTGTNMCNYSCPSGMQACTSGGTTTCIAMGGCCTSSDCGACKTCSASHTCVAVTNADDPLARCAGTCDATGLCKSKKGQTCTATAGGCISGTTCAGGSCCTTSCGTDATCAGSCAGRTDGVCQYPTSRCGSASCSGTNFVDRGTCSNGSCAPATAAACTGGYVCSGSACKTMCSVATDCVSTSYCAASMCSAKKGAGQLCSGNAECTSGSCGGRCCNNGTSCSCPQPNVSNVVMNAGLDTNLASWQAGSGWSWNASDSDACPFSGSASIDNRNGTADSAQLSQCVSLQKNTLYNFGFDLFALLRSGAQTLGQVEVDFYNLAGCPSSPNPFYLSNWDSGTWSSGLGGTVNSGNSQSARIFFWAEPGVQLLVDKVFMTPVSAGGTF